MMQHVKIVYASRAMMGYLVVAVLVMLSNSKASFALVSSPGHASFRFLPVPARAQQILRAATSSYFTEEISRATQQIPPQKAAQDLLKLVLKTYRYPTNDDTVQQMNDGITNLAQGQVSFDPAECLNGPLYVVLHQQGPKIPLWKKIGLFDRGGNSNLQGQIFELNPMGDFNLVNYAEVFGKSIFVEARGTARPVSTNKSDKLIELAAGKPSLSMLDNLSNLLSPLLSINDNEIGQPSSSKNMLQCPCDIEATVNGGGLFSSKGGKEGDKKLLLDLPFIQGKGLVRILYADPKIRIFLSPTQGDGGWEDKGLIVVQVRQDLVLEELRSRSMSTFR